MQIIRRIFLITITYVSISGCVHFYSYEPINLRVVDANTKQPLEGVIVVARWQKSISNWHARQDIGSVEVMETVSDKNGEVYFPEWGPKMVFRGYLHPAMLIFFKSGYEVRKGDNWVKEGENHHDPAAYKTSPWNGETVTLKKFNGNLKDYAEHIDRYDTFIDYIRDGKDCEWKQTPLLLVEIHKLADEVEKQQIKLRGWQVGNSLKKVTDVYNIKECGSPEKFFEKYITLKKSSDKSTRQVEMRTLSPSVTFEDPTPINKQ